MRVVVTGATGNVGTSLLDRLAANDEVTEVLGLARRLPGVSWPKTSFARADVAEDDLAPHLRGADVVVHLAWLFQPVRRPAVTWRTNVGGTLRVLSTAAREHVGALVFASSVGAYSPGSGAAVDESWPTDGTPTAAYGREKAYVERLLDIAEERERGLRIVRMRPGFIFQGAASGQQRQLFAGPFAPVSLLRSGRLPALPYPEGLSFQALHANDAAKAFERAVVSDVRGAFNVAAEPLIDGPLIARLLGARPLALPPVVVRTALDLAWRAHLVPVEPGLLDLALGLPVMSTERARRELGWEADVSAADAVAEALRSMSERTVGATPPLAGAPSSGRLTLLKGRGGRL